MADNNYPSVSVSSKKHHQTQTTSSDITKINKILVNNNNHQSSISTQTVPPQPVSVSVTSSSVAPPSSTNNHMHNNSMKKKTSFQITSVTVGSSRLSNDGGDDSADDLDESHTDDISRITDNETPSFSEDTLSRDEAVVSTVIPTSAQYGLAILPEGASTVQIPSTTNHTVPNSVNITAIEEIVGSPAKSNSPRADTPNKENAPEIPPPQRSERFKVVKIESTEPFRRGRWMCMDYLDHSVNQPHNSPFFKPITDTNFIPQTTTQLNGLPQTMGPITIAPPQTLPVAVAVQNGTVGGAATTTNYQPARTVAAPTQNSPVQQQQPSNQQPQPQIVTSNVTVQQQSQSVPPPSNQQPIIQQSSANPIQPQPQKPPPPNQQQQPSQQQPPTTTSTTIVQQSSSSSQTQALPPSSAGANAPLTSSQQITSSNITLVQTQAALPPTSSVYQYMNPNPPFGSMMPIVVSSTLTSSTSANTQIPTQVSSGGTGTSAAVAVQTPLNTSQTQPNLTAPPHSSSATASVVSTATSTTSLVANTVPPATSQPQPYVPSSFTQTSMVQSPLTSVPPQTTSVSVSVSTSSASTSTPSTGVSSGAANTQGQTYAGHPMSTQQIPVQAQSYSGQQIQHQFMPPQNYPQNIQVNNGSNRWTTPRLDGVGSGDAAAAVLSGGGVPSVSGTPFTYPTSTSVFQVPGGGGNPVQQAPIIMTGVATSGVTTSGLTRTPSLSNIQQHGGGNGMTATSLASSMTAQQHSTMLSQVQQQAAQMLMVSLSPTTTGVNVEPQTLIAAINANQLIGGSMSSTGSSIGSTNSDTVGAGAGTGVNATSLLRTDNSGGANVTGTGTGSGTTGPPSSTGNVTDDESVMSRQTTRISTRCIGYPNVPPKPNPNILKQPKHETTIYFCKCCKVERFRTSAASTVAIDNKIEQAMDLVKSHLMFAVREEVEVLKEKIAELMDRINQLELENSILKANASAEVLQQLPSPCISNQTQLSQMTTMTGPGGGGPGTGPGGLTTGPTMITSLTSKTPSTAASSLANVTNVATTQQTISVANQSTSTT